ncbi:putative SNAP25 protein SNAP30 [Arabidopsis thaliana]|uniref:SNAP30 n=2 Tax=Arabidopsis TaxID=3701 RepID=A0A178WHU5_ARATH|nr:Target SNARE coiled-coil homology domain [Arabidopsis thaliana x Arabidopsis arenosa]OAP17826.1 SNAP30 [Arabidopsis thaliana]
MFGFFKSPGNNKLPNESSNNKGGTITAGRRTSSEPILITPDFDDDDKYKNGFNDSGGLQSQTTEELEKYAVYKAEETTKGVNNCLKIAEDIRSDGARTLEMLHQQGEQINRTHEMAVDMDKDLSRGEKLLNNLGGMFSKPWKPKKTKNITGPMITPDKPSKKSENHKEEREKLGLGAKGRSSSQPALDQPTNASQKVEQEKAKQDDGLSDLSDILGDLKSMAVDMGSEIDKQNKALDHLGDDVDELNSRVQGANQRARHLLSK